MSKKKAGKVSTRIAGRSTVLAALAAQKEGIKSVGENVEKHLRKIFAVPIASQQVEGFQSPVYAKSDSVKDFLSTALKSNFLFDNLNESDINKLIDAFQEYKTDAMQYIIQEGDEGDYFYVLRRGKATVRIGGKGTVGTIEEAGSCFGELALLYYAPRMASVYAETDCVLFRLDQKTFRTILQTQRQGADQKKLDVLKSIPQFQSQQMDPASLVKLARAMKTQSFQKGDFLFRKGETIDVFYVIQEGNVSVTDITVGGSKYEDQIFGSGDSLGWRYIVLKEPVVATVQAITDGSVLVIDSKTFLAVMGETEKAFRKPDDRRWLKGVTVFSDSCLDGSLLSAMADSITEEHFSKDCVIAEEGKETEAALYLVREGKVQVKSVDYTFDKVVTYGGYFGEDQLLADHVLLGKGEKPIITSKYTVTVLEDCSVGVLKVEELRKILNTTVLGLGKDPTNSPMDTCIQMEDLKRHVMLGAGSFGQVWLVSAEGSDGNRRAYALKVQSKYQLVDTQQAEGVVSEKNVMARLCNPFIIQLVNTYQDDQRVYMLTGLLQGGELATVLYQSEYMGIDEESAKFYAAGILEGLTFMHRRRIIHRDLKPQNVMINSAGYPVIIDLGFAKYVPDKTYTFCGTPIYIAPEVITYRGHDKGADHWSLACMIYEFCSGENPFWEHKMEELALFKKIVRGRFLVQGWMSVELKMLLVSMLVPDPTKRLGSLSGGSNDIFGASWFSDIDFKAIRKQEVEAPWVPDTHDDPLDSSNFYDVEDTVEDKFKSEDPQLSPDDQLVFQSF